MSDEPGVKRAAAQASGNRPRLLYVEDDREIAAMVVEVLSESYEVDHVTEGDAAVRRALGQRYDVMVVDRRLPGFDGIDLVRAARRARITTPILLLTALDAPRDRVGGLDAGANDYLVKPFDFDELLARLRALRRGFRAEGTRRYVGEWLYVPESQALYSPTGSRATLTATENALMELLTDSPEHVFTREEILAAVFRGGETAGSVDTYVHFIRRKTAKEVIETVRARGYRAGTA
ncbi:response regulator transcription factor [Humibacter sp. RRB41]|uniref:response regulator transcription factor n=1 Tax=Humibacter sp. RRB41 TaxID=2919946 RepID=UPI001FAA70F6|nr:response regulator transcription factor [Humibacter sp. RRB41]